MTADELEAQLRQLGADWPAPSVTEAVMARLPRHAPRRRWRFAAVGLAAALLLVVLPAVLWLLATPGTLQAQVQRALEKAGTAHVVITSFDDQGGRQKAEVWYARGRGFRAESPDEVLVDDGRQQWSWRPDARPAELIVARRASRDAVNLITAMFRLDNAPLDWQRQRAADHDRAVNGRPCQAFLVTPPNQTVLSADGADLVPDPNPLRILVLADPEQRIVRVEHQRQRKGAWRAEREITLAYDVEIAAAKFAADFPAGARVVDADRVLPSRFPLEKALAKVEAGGLLFAVHELERAEGETFYVVSSVRGTPEHLKAFPPRPRRLNLQTTILDVAEQVSSAQVDSGLHRAVVAVAEADGVHYLWWVAARRNFFRVEDGKRVPAGESPALEPQPGQVRLPLIGRARDPRADGNWVNAVAEVALPADAPPKPWKEIAGRARRDALLVSQGAGPVVTLYGAIDANQMRRLDPARVTDAEVAAGLQAQLDWLHKHDELGPPIDVPPGHPAPGNQRP